MDFGIFNDIDLEICNTLEVMENPKTHNITALAIQRRKQEPDHTEIKFSSNIWISIVKTTEKTEPGSMD